MHTEAQHRMVSSFDSLTLKVMNVAACSNSLAMKSLAVSSVENSGKYECHPHCITSLTPMSHNKHEAIGIHANCCFPTAIRNVQPPVSDSTFILEFLVKSPFFSNASIFEKILFSHHHGFISISGSIRLFCKQVCITLCSQITGNNTNLQ